MCTPASTARWAGAGHSRLSSPNKPAASPDVVLTAADVGTDGGDGGGGSGKDRGENRIALLGASRALLAASGAHGITAKVDWAACAA